MAETKDGSGATVRRVNVNFSPGIYEMLEALSEKKGKSMADILRDAIALENWVEDERSKGAKILIERDGEIRELVFR